jgi:hypothetical protein
LAWEGKRRIRLLKGWNAGSTSQESYALLHTKIFRPESICANANIGANAKNQCQEQICQPHCHPTFFKLEDASDTSKMESIAAQLSIDTPECQV